MTSPAPIFEPQHPRPETRDPQPATTTASSGVAETYYGIPPIRAPHWRWLVINYFFLEGIAGCTFAIATLADLAGKDPQLVRVGRYLSFLAGLPSPVLLALDLGRPDRALHMFRIVKLKSPMSLGAWALLIVGSMSGMVATMQLAADVTKRNMFAGARRWISVFTLPFSLFVSGYTGTLLAATTVPLWARNFPLMGPTFISSAFSTSFASLSMALTLGRHEREDTARSLARAETVVLATELSLLMAGVLRLGKLGRPLTRGALGAIFWPVTIVTGLITPLILQITALRRGSPGSSGRRIVTSLLVLIGGYSLRTLMIFAGRKSATRAEDYLEYTRRPKGGRAPWDRTP